MSKIALNYKGVHFGSLMAEFSESKVLNYFQVDQSDNDVTDHEDVLEVVSKVKFLKICYNNSDLILKYLENRFCI